MMSRRRQSQQLLPPGHILADRYWIRSLVGSMTGGAVYLATEAGRAAISPGRTVVVRLYDDPWVEGAEGLLRLSHLIHESSAITHPNLARLVDLGSDAGQAYCATEWIDQGMLLNEYVQLEHGLSLEAFAPIAGQVLNAVGHAHARSKFFGDLDGSSVILGERNGRAHHVVLTAFGLTQDVATESPRTTPYWAPEKVGPADMFNLRRDVYSIGVLLWYMLTAEFPADDPTRSLAESRGDLPRGLTRLIDECVALEPVNRPADANVVLRRLCEFIPAQMFRLPEAQRRSTRSLPDAPAGTAIDLPNIDRLRELVRNESTVRKRVHAAPIEPEPIEPETAALEPLPVEMRRRRWWPIGFGLVTVASAAALWAQWI